MHPSAHPPESDSGHESSLLHRHTADADHRLPDTDIFPVYPESEEFLPMHLPVDQSAPPFSSKESMAMRYFPAGSEYPED